MHLDNALFLDWFASLAGIYNEPEPNTYYRLQLSRGAFLQVSSCLGGPSVPLSVVEVLQRCYRYTPLPVARTRPAATLARLAKRPRSNRLVLEATMQRRRLYPLWLRWIESLAAGEFNARDCDRYLLRFQPRVAFDDLVVFAQILPWIGPGLMWALFRADAVKAAELFEAWLAAGEHGRFRDLGHHLPLLAPRYDGTPIYQTFLRVGVVLIDRGDAAEKISREVSE